MRRFSTLMLVTAVFCGLALAGQSTAADKPEGQPPKQEGGPGGPGGGAGGGPGGPPGGVHLIPRFAEAKLNLTEDQKKQIADLEKDVKEKLAKIVTADQMKTLEEARPPRGGQGGQGGGSQGGPGGGQGGPGGGQNGPNGGGEGGGPPKRPQPPAK